MALNYELGEIENWKELPEGTVQCMVFGTMFTGINRITEKNWREFATRLRMWETVHGPIRADGELMDPGVARDFIGLWTNATSLTPAKFAKTLTDSMRRNAESVTARA